MINAGIFDGDQVIIEKCSDAKNGEIVVALIDQNEATLKRLFKRGQQVALQPENPTFKTVIYGPDRVQIQGVLKSLIRKY
jgi:repressor LexA